ncbi:MAG: peptide-N-glycosidase F-related protein [Sandaracinaceae bacterium]
MSRRFTLLSSLLALSVASACDDGPSPSDAGSDAGGMDAGPGLDAGPDPSAICAELGIDDVVPFDATATGTALETVAGDFTVHTLDGDWTLSERWSGCESYVFLVWSNTDYANGLFASGVDELFTLGPRNAHYFFSAATTDAAEAAAKAEEMRLRIEDGFEFQGVSAEDREYWRAHFHYVDQPIQDATGSVAELVRTAPIPAAFAITREQRFDPVGSLMTVGGAGFVPLMSMARFVPPFFDYIRALDKRIADATDATVVPLLTDEVTTMRTLERTVTLPSATEMAGFDTLEVDVELTCIAAPEDCSEWDRIAYVFVCDDATCADPQELVRWITPYSRPGRRRWLMDASALIALLGDGGERTFRVVFGPDWEEPTERTVSVNLMLSSRGAPDRAFAAERAFVGGTFDATYNAAHTPFSFTPPAGTTRVELVTIVSGHGQTMVDNCAEWCNHEHAFSVNGASAHTIGFDGMAGTRNGCAEMSGQGVPPGQWGNWSPLRAGWCPGLPLPVRREDVTSDVMLGMPNELTYTASFAGGEPRGGDISLSTYVVYFR